jgi:Zn-dependent protease
MDIIITIFTLLVLLFSVVIHEVAHGSIALYLGDPTAKDAGRLTLNPLKHLDLMGSLLVPLFLWWSGLPMFAWAKPVPINPYNFRDQKWGNLKVSIAGPVANFLIAIFFGFLLRFFAEYLSTAVLTFFSIIVIYNFLLGIFNLIPIPPLDGHHVLFALLPERMSNVKIFLRRYSLLLLMVFFLSGGGNLVFLTAEFLYNLVLGF